MPPTLTIDDSEIVKGLGLFQKQAPYAMSLAINAVAKQATIVLKGTVTDYLTIRNKYTQSGIQMERGNKATLDAKVGVIDTRWWMASHATGDDARHDPDGGLVHIAASGEDGAPRPSPEKMVPRSLRMDRITDQTEGGRQYFVFRKDGKAIGIFYRNGTERLSRRKTMHGRPVPAMVRPRLPLEIAYTFAHEVRIRKDWPMEDVIAQVVEATWPKAVQDAVITALWTAK